MGQSLVNIRTVKELQIIPTLSFPVTSEKGDKVFLHCDIGLGVGIKENSHDINDIRFKTATSS